MNSPMRGYFDYASATPVDDAVFSAMKDYISDQFYNPSAVYQKALDVHEGLERARACIASCLGVKSQEIVFTSGCTEANNLAIRGVMSKYPSSRLLISSIEHDSVSEVAKKYDHNIIPVLQNGIVNLDEFTKLLTEEVVLVSIVLASNEIGVIQPMREIGLLIDQERKRRGPQGMPLYLHTDAAQAANYIAINANGLRVDMMSLNSGKVYGPKGAGSLYVSGDIELEPLVFGGGQERGMRSGTENVASIVGFAFALEATQAMRDEESERLRILQCHMIQGLEHLGGIINGDKHRRLPNNVHVRLPGIDNERLVLELDRDGYMVSSGSACHAKNGVPSLVLEAIGLSRSEANESIRITMGRQTSVDDVESLLSALTVRLAKNR